MMGCVSSTMATVSYFGGHSNHSFGLVPVKSALTFVSTFVGPVISLPTIGTSGGGMPFSITFVTGLSVGRMMKPIIHAVQQMLLIDRWGLGPVSSLGTETTGVALVEVCILDAGSLESATVPPTTDCLLVSATAAAAELWDSRLRIRIKDGRKPNARQNHK